MRVLLDACVLYPTVLREILIEVAAKGHFTPLWSARILEEWARAVAKNHPVTEVIARGEIALLKVNWPTAEVSVLHGAEDGLTLPDPDDLHVLAAAIAGQADELLTANAQDFPTRVLSTHGILRRDPDGFLLELAQQSDDVATVVEHVRARAEMISGEDQVLRPFLKRAKLPRLGKHIG